MCVYLFFLFLCAGTGKHPKCFHHRLEDCRVLCSLQHRFAAPVFPSLVAFRAMCSSKMRRAWNEWKDLSKGASKQHFVDVFLIMFDHVSSAWPARRWELRSPEIASCFDLWWVVRLATGCSVGSIATFLYTTRYRPLPLIFRPITTHWSWNILNSSSLTCNFKGSSPFHQSIYIYLRLQ